MKAVFVGGKYHGQIMEVEDVRKISNGTSKDWSIARNAGALVPRAELDNQPIVAGYLGPFWDGGRLRYETQSVYNAMSE